VAAAHRVAGPDDAALVEFVDAAVAFLLARGAWKEASRLLQFAVERQSLARWQRGLWILQMADIEKHSGDIERAWSRFAQALELLGFGRIDSSRGTALDVLRVLARDGAIDREVPEPLRGGVYGAAVSALIGLGQLAGFAGEGGLCARLGLLALAVARRTDDRDASAVGFAGFAYGSLLLGSAGVARAAGRRARRRAPPPNHGPKAAFAQETIAAYEYAAGHWHLALPRLDETAAAMRRLRQPRHEVECRSLAAKLLALQGRLEEAQRRFVELGDSVRGSEQTYTLHWSLLGIVETALRTGSHSAQQLLGLLEQARREMSDVQTIDSAYVIRWLGLRAAACALAGDQEGIREAAISGASVIERVRICGFWAHEGFGGIAEALIACRERDRALGMSGSALDPALRQAMRGFGRHVKRFPPGRARLHYCRGLLAASDARPAEAANELRKAVRLADRFGLRHELARACERLGRLDDTDAAGAWLERARRLYEETGARNDLDRMAPQPGGRPASIRVAV